MLQTSPKLFPAPLEAVTDRSDAASFVPLGFPSGLVLRQFCAQDAGGVYDLLAQEDFQRNGWTLEPLSSIDDLLQIVIETGQRNLEIVATLGETIVGFAGLYVFGGRQAHVGSFVLGVHERFQRIGVGTALMKAVVGAGFQLMGLQRLQATVFTDNARALSLYRRFGFEVEGRISRFARRADGFVDAHMIALIPPCD